MIERACWPAVITSGVWLRCAVKILPSALPTPAAGMQIDEAGVAGGLRVAVGHADDGGFLQAEHVVDVVGPVAQERQFGRAGIAEHFFDAERAQQAEAWRP